MVHLAGGEGRAAAVARVVQGEHGVAGARGGQQRRQLVKTGRGVEVAVQGHPLHRGCTGTGRTVLTVTSTAVLFVCTFPAVSIDTGPLLARDDPPWHRECDLLANMAREPPNTVKHSCLICVML